MRNVMQLPASMHAVEIADMGPHGSLRPTTRPVPRPKAGEILIRVEAIGVCRPDSLQRRGMHPPPAGASDLPGPEVAGKITLLGKNIQKWQVGDAVCARLPGCGYAEYGGAPWHTILPTPASRPARERGS